MEASTPQQSKSEGEDEGLFVVIVGEKIDEQPKNADNENNQPLIQIDVQPENSFLCLTKEIKQESSDINTLSSDINTISSDIKTETSDIKTESEDIKSEDDFGPMVEEYIISDETYVSSNEGNKNEINAACETYKPLPLDNQKSFVRELCRINPALINDEEALVTALYKIMKDTKPPPPPEGIMIERNKTFECIECVYKTSKSRDDLVCHWQEMHGPRYLICLACGADFTCTTPLYEHEKICTSPDAWLLVKARNRVLRHGTVCKKAVQKSETPKKIVAKSKALGRAKVAKNKDLKLPIASKSNASKRPIPALKRNAASSNNVERPKAAKSKAVKTSAAKKKGPKKVTEIYVDLDSSDPGPLKAGGSNEDYDSDLQYPTDDDESDGGQYLELSDDRTYDPLNLLELKPSLVSKRDGKRKPPADIKREHSIRSEKDDPMSFNEIKTKSKGRSKSPVNKTTNSEQKASLLNKPSNTHVDGENDQSLSINNETDGDALETKTKSKGSTKLIVEKEVSCNKESGQSYLNDLFEKRPDLMQDEELLIQTLSDLMWKEKSPHPPKDSVLITSDGLYQCATCDYKQKSKIAANRHWLRNHGSVFVKCYACGARFGDTFSLYGHEKKCKAPYADIVLNARASVKRPETDNGSPKKYKCIINKATGCRICSFCPREFKSKDALQAHERDHRGELPYRCTECPAAYTSISALSHHKQRKHTDQAYLCDKCDRVFRQKTQLHKHLDTHLSVKPYACTECVRRFSQKIDLRIHIDRDHRKLPYPYACKLCPQRCPLMTKLRQHMLQKHGMNVISRKALNSKLPEISQKQLKSVSIVTPTADIHLRSDLQIIDDVKNEEAMDTDCSVESNPPEIIGEVEINDAVQAKKAFECPHCGKGYASKMSLKKHVNRIHLNLFPFACQICYKRCTEEKYLQTHMLKQHGIKIEREEKPKPKRTEKKEKKPGTYRNKYGVLEAIHMDSTGKRKCPECDKKYSNISDLRKHVNKIHLNLPKPYACKLCDKRCMKMVTLKDHMWKTHGMQIIARKNFEKCLPNLTEEQLKSIIPFKRSEYTPDIYKTVQVSGKNPTGTFQIDHDYIDTEIATVSQIYTEEPQYSGTSNKTFTSSENVEETLEDGAEVALDACEVVGNEVEIDYEEECEEYDEEESGEEEPPTDLKEIVKKYKEESPKTKPMLIIKDGQAAYMDGDNVDYFKKTSNCKVNNSPKVRVQYQEDLITETSNTLLGYYERFCNETNVSNKKPPTPKMVVKGKRQIQAAKNETTEVEMKFGKRPKIKPKRK